MQPQDVARRRAERSDLRALSSTVLRPETGNQRFFVDVNPAALRIEHFHLTPLSRGAPGSATGWEFTWRAPQSLEGCGQQYGVPEARHSGPFFSGLGAPVSVDLGPARSHW